jgi:RNA polymerase sigma-70 factor (ECF subfamily)
MSVRSSAARPAVRHLGPWRCWPGHPGRAGLSRLPGRIGLEPERQSEWRELVDVLRHTVEQDLSERQRRVFVAIVLDGVPLDALCIELHTGRGAICKTLFDARRKIRGALVAKGYLDGEAVRHP